LQQAKPQLLIIELISCTCTEVNSEINNAGSRLGTYKYFIDIIQPLGDIFVAFFLCQVGARSTFGVSDV